MAPQHLPREAAHVGRVSKGNNAHVSRALPSRTSWWDRRAPQARTGAWGSEGLKSVRTRAAHAWGAPLEELRELRESCSKSWRSWGKAGEELTVNRRLLRCSHQHTTARELLHLPSELLADRGHVRKK